MHFLCGATEVLKRERWMFKVGGGLYASRQQLPLKLAWAISIHKSQVSGLPGGSLDTTHQGGGTPSVCMGFHHMRLDSNCLSRDEEGN